MEQDCKNINCPYATEYGCVSEVAKRKIANDGMGITVAITPQNQIAIYYVDIFDCEKWERHA